MHSTCFDSHKMDHCCIIIYYIILIFRYMSKFREQVQLEKEVNKAPSKTMGPAKVDVPSPQKYLLKHSKQPKLPESTCPALFETI